MFLLVLKRKTPKNPLIITSPRSESSSSSDSCYIGIQETALPYESFAETEASLELPQLQENDDCNIAPLHLLLNGVLTVFKRASCPSTLSKKYLRFFQNFAASNPGEVDSLLQAEVLLCPSLFHNQQADGSCTGAIPYFLLEDQSDNSRFGFASSHQRALARINKLELPVSANVNYLFSLTDILLHVRLHKTSTNGFFKRGIQNIDV